MSEGIQVDTFILETDENTNSRDFAQFCFCAIRKTTHFCRKVFIEIVLYFVGVFTANTLFMSQTIKGHLHGLSVRLCLCVCCIYLDCTSVPPNNKGVETVYI